MNTVSRITFLFAVLCLAAASCSAADAPETSVDTVSGRVFLDANGNGKFDPGEKPLAGIHVTDSVHFTTTAADGTYTIHIGDDSQIPYKPARVVSVSWPSGKWPSGRWWRRLSEIKPGESVDFGLKDDEQKKPFVFVQTSDDHASGAIYPKLGTIIKQQCGPMARFAINTGDLGYANPASMDDEFSTILANSKQFPIPMIFTPGNHDVCGRTAPEWNQPRYGDWGFTKYLGPVRWSFSYAGVHFSGVDWADVKNGSLEHAPEVACDWLEEDYKSLPPGERKFVFLHCPNAGERFFNTTAKCKVDHVFGGHTHIDREYNFAGVPSTTVLNTGSLAAMLTVVQDDSFDIVHWCAGCKTWDYHNKRCPIKMFRDQFKALASRRGAHGQIADKQLADGTATITAGEGPAEIAAVIDPQKSVRCGLRIGDKTTVDVLFDGKTVMVAGTPVPFVLREQDKGLDWHFIVENDQLTICANSLFRLAKQVKIDNPSKVTLVAEGGGATFGKVEVWNLASAAAPIKKHRSK